MALFHFTVDQMKRSEGQSAIASAAYRSGERLYSEYYGEYSDYTRKGGVICSDILLPSHAPPEFADRQTLWNAVELVERGKKAQLAYSFEIALQNEFTIEENIALARQFLLDNFVSRGMTVDVAFHEKETEDGGLPNPHFHFLCPMRPMNPDGTWGFKQHRVYRLDEDGNRIRDQNGKFLFDAVPTTDWGSPETLEHWRKAWADVCNAKFEEKGLDVRIDHRSYLRQGVDLLPTVHEGAAVRAMEKKGIWNDKLAEIWSLLTESPQTFKGGQVWGVMTGIHSALQAIGYGLLVLFFAVGVMKTCGSFVEVKKPEHALKLFIRFALAKGAVTYGLELMLAVFSIVQGMVSTIITQSGSSGMSSVTLPQELIDAINNVGFWDSIPLWAVTLIGGLLITVLSFTMILTVYGRMFSLWMYAAIAPIPLSTFAGEPTSSVGKNFIRSYAGVCLQGVVIALSCIIFSAISSSPPAVDTGASVVTAVWTYVGELAFNLLVLVGAIKGCDRIVKEIMGL